MREFDALGAEADGYLVEDASGAKFFAKVYRRGITPNSTILEALTRAAPEHVIQLIEHGVSEDGYAYEILEYATEGTLSDLIKGHGPKLDPALVRELLQELVDAVSHVHSLSIEHRDLKPENVLLRSRDPLDLVLTDFGIASVVEATVHFTTANRTARYSPPEAMTGSIYRTRWDYWSVGMILVEMLAGQHPFEGMGEQAVNGQLATMVTDHLVAGVADPDWRNLCRGLLRRDPASRWDSAKVQLWLKNPGDRSLVVADEGAPAGAARPGFRVAGMDFHSPQALAEALSKHWSDAQDLWKRRNEPLRAWLLDELGERDLVRALVEIDTQPAGLDAQVFLFLHALAPSRPPAFKDRLVTHSSLAEVAVGVMSGESEPTAWLANVYGENILTLAVAMSGADERLGRIATEWRSAVDEYRRLSADVVNGSGNRVVVPALDPQSQLPALLAAATSLQQTRPGSPAPISVLRSLARSVSTASARECGWYRRLGDAATATPAAALLLHQLAAIAEQQTATERLARDLEVARVDAERRQEIARFAASAAKYCGVAIILAISFFAMKGLLSWYEVSRIKKTVYAAEIQDSRGVNIKTIPNEGGGGVYVYPGKFTINVCFLNGGRGDNFILNISGRESLVCTPYKLNGRVIDCVSCQSIILRSGDYTAKIMVNEIEASSFRFYVGSNR